MEHITLMNIYKRVHSKYKENCDKCPLSLRNNGTGTSCMVFLCDYPDKAEITLIGWDLDQQRRFRRSKGFSAKPVKTRLEDFLDKYPKAKVDDYGTPQVCTGNLGYVDKCPEEHDCKKCWNQTMDE